MRIGIITGSGSEDWPLGGEPARRVVTTKRAEPGSLLIFDDLDGPRFNSRSEIAALAAAGVTAVSRTAGPEVVLAGEAELPMALVGYVTDYANGVAPPEPAGALTARLRESGAVFAGLAARTLSALGERPPAAGFVYRLGS